LTSPSTLLLSTAYFPPVNYFALISGFSIFIIEKHENYSKQSYRNRCNILSANGVLPLVIPVKRNRGGSTIITDVRCDNSYNWQRQHRISIESAYRSAPFYEYYIDEIMPFFESPYSFLIDLNSEILLTILGILQLPAEIRYTDHYQKTPEGEIQDARDIHPKKKEYGTVREYPQVFGDKFGFVPGLSIIDLIFNMGPDARRILDAT
jgi:hypothetical protein